MQKLLKGQLAIITGGGRGIGKVIANRFASEGCDLALVSRSKSQLKDVADTITQLHEVKVSSFEIDVSSERDVLSMVEKVHKIYGKISILVNNAAIIGPIGEVSDIDGNKFLETLNINVGGTFFCTKAVVKYMKNQNQGNIINLSGGGGLSSFPFYDAYSASKSAIVRLTENFAIELEKYNIKVCAISPGAVNTQMFYDQLRQDKLSLGVKNWENLQNQLANGGESADKAADLALFLATQKDNKFNGRVISAIWDNWTEISRKKIINHELFKMRRIISNEN
jgi:NAD(P)-dependent dehydrogenase (short-subunit alcohol dehydrogenase family)